MTNIMDLFNPANLRNLLAPAQAQGNFLTRPDLPALPSASIAAAPQVAAYQAPVQSAAQAMPQMGQQQPRSPMGGLGDFFTPDRKAALNDFFTGLALGDDWQSGLALGAANVNQNKASRQQRNQTVDFLKGKGLSDQEASQIASNPAVLSDYLKGVYSKDENKLINAGGSLYNQQTGEWITPPAGAGKQTEYGLNLVYGKDENGNTVAFQLSKEGTYKPFTPPNGVQLTPGVSQVDTGTGTVLLNNKTGEQVGQISKDVAGASQQRQEGTITADSKAALPGIETAADIAIKTIDDLANDPYLGSMLGPVDSRLPNVTTDAARVQGKMDQLQGQAFLQAFNSLKGGGAITEVEGQKAESAIARLKTAQSEPDYKSALKDFRDIIEQGRQNARKKAGVSSYPSAGNDYKSKYGLD